MVDARGEATGIARKIGEERFGRKQADGEDGPRGGRVFKRGPGLVEGKETGDGMRSGCAGAADRTMCGRGSVLPPLGPGFRVYFFVRALGEPLFWFFLRGVSSRTASAVLFFLSSCPYFGIFEHFGRHLDAHQENHHSHF